MHKDEEPGSLLEAIRETSAGKGCGSSGSEKTADPNGRSASEQASFTPRERQVYALLLERHSNAYIAKELGISPQTAKNHACNILRKLGVGRRGDLPWGDTLQWNVLDRGAMPPRSSTDGDRKREAPG